MCLFESRKQGRTEHYQPLRFLDAVGVGLGISQRLPFCIFGFLDLVGGAVADEDGFAAPFDDYLRVHTLLSVTQSAAHERGERAEGERFETRGSYIFALRDGRKIDLDLRLREHVRGGGHVD